MLSLARGFAVCFYVLFLFASPLMFRFSMYLGSIVGNKTEYYDPGNAVINAIINWESCKESERYPGVSLVNSTIFLTRVRNPSINEGTPSMSLFFTTDGDKWYNYYHPERFTEPYITNFSRTIISIGNNRGNEYRIYIKTSHYFLSYFL